MLHVINYKIIDKKLKFEINNKAAEDVGIDFDYNLMKLAIMINPDGDD